MIRLFTDDVNKPSAYKKIDRLTIDFISTGNRFPADKITLKEFENKTGINRKPNWKQYRSYLAEMCKFCEDILDKEKTPALAGTLLELLKQDDNIQTIFYGCEFISKSRLYGIPAHPKKICIEALLLGLLYQTLKKFTPADAGTVQLIDSELNFIHVIWLGDRDSPIFWGDCSELMQILNPELDISVRESLQSRMKSETLPCYPLEIFCQNKKILLNFKNGFYPSLFDYVPGNDIFLYASGGFGKSFLLQHQNGLFLSLSGYHKEIREKINPDCSCWILIHILLKYHYHYLYQTYDLCEVCEGEETALRHIAELLNLFRTKSENQHPKYTLLLDGVNEISADENIFSKELQYIRQEWCNVRIIMTSRNADAECAEDFEKIEVTGIPDDFRDALLSEYSIGMNHQLFAILKAPLFLKYFLQNQGSHDALNTRGEILDAYFTNEIKSYEKSLRFVIKYALPFLAKNPFRFSFRRSDIMEAIEKAIQIYLHQNHVYQNLVAPEHLRKQEILSAWRSIDFVDILIEKTGILAVVDNRLEFAHDYLHDYFAARYILNAVHTLETDRCQELFDALELDNFWWKSNDIPGELIGELCGDYRNIPDKNGILDYHETELDTLLDIAREFHTDMILYYVLRVMTFSRNHLICNVDCSNLFFSFFSESLQFSDNGSYPSNFHGCKIFYLPDNESRIFCADFSSDGKNLLLGMENSHVILWDVRAGRVLKNYNLHPYLKYGETFENITFLNDNTQFTVITAYNRFLIETATGNILNIQPENHSFPYSKRTTAFSPDRIHFLIDDTICSVTGERKKIQFPEICNHFKNCDFRDVIFLSNHDKNKEVLRKSGAVTE